MCKESVIKHKDNLINKEKYKLFCEKIYVPIYSKPWWMDALCGEEKWDVWICESNGRIEAAMPYYYETRGEHIYITKAPLTQNNGIIFNHPKHAKEIAKAKFEEEVINEACKFIKDLNIDVYEQQYQTSFKNWSPFFWNNYTAIVRYTDQIMLVDDIEQIWNEMSGKKRATIKKGLRNSTIEITKNIYLFYEEHKKIFQKQGMECPFSVEVFERLVISCMKYNCGKMIFARNCEGKITSLSFCVWDQKYMYHLIGGGIPEFQNQDSYSALIWQEIQEAFKKKLIYDFEGSVIKRISKANREYGAKPVPYFRIRKVFNPKILRQETEEAILKTHDQKRE